MRTGVEQPLPTRSTSKQATPCLTETTTARPYTGEPCFHPPSDRSCDPNVRARVSPFCCIAFSLTLNVVKLIPDQHVVVSFSSLKNRSIYSIVPILVSFRNDEINAWSQCFYRKVKGLYGNYHVAPLYLFLTALERRTNLN